MWKKGTAAGGIPFVLFGYFPTWPNTEVLTVKQTPSQDHDFLADHWGWQRWWLTGAKVSPRGIHCGCFRARFIVCSSSLTISTSSLETENVKWSITAAAAKSLSRVRLCETPETAAHQALPSLGFCRQEHWSGRLQFFLSSIHLLIFRSKKLLAPCCCC